MSLCRLFFDIVTILERNPTFPTDTPFDYQLAMDRLRDFHAPRDKLRRLCEKGEIVQVKKGIYIAGPTPDGQQSVDPRVLVGLVYGPSYLSLESALSQYGMIPERVSEMTCITSKRAKVFETPIGRFRYRPIPERAFALGVERKTARGGSYLIASPEKALCDRIAQARHLSTQRDVSIFLFEDLRIDEAHLADFDRELIETIAQQYRRISVTRFAAWLQKYQRRTSL